MTRPPIVQAPWQPWIDAVCEPLGVDPAWIDIAEVHELTSAIASGFVRAMAPVSAYIWGLARTTHPDTDPDALRASIIAALPADPGDVGPDDREAWRPFLAQAATVAGVAADRVPVDSILELTREIAHAGARPVAPVGAYVWGLASGRADADPAHLQRVLEDAVSAAPVPAG